MDLWQDGLFRSGDDIFLFDKFKYRCLSHLEMWQPSWIAYHDGKNKSPVCQHQGPYLYEQNNEKQEFS